jgi:hypothetical protein
LHGSNVDGGDAAVKNFDRLSLRGRPEADSPSTGSG